MSYKVSKALRLILTQILVEPQYVQLDLDRYHDLHL